MRTCICIAGTCSVINTQENPRNSDGMLHMIRKGTLVKTAYMHVRLSFSVPECNGKQCFILFSCRTKEEECFTEVLKTTPKNMRAQF